MDLFTHSDFDDHEQLVFAHDARAGLRAIIAVHSTTRGPALGGCRIWNYASESEALTDVLRLSCGMSYKAALAGLPLGGGKSVILADPGADKTPEMMRAMGRAIERLAGRYIAAEDVGATVADMDEIAKETSHVSGVTQGVGDPSPWTAQGAFLAMEAAAQFRWESGLEGRKISVTGLGNVGARLCKLLSEAGAELFVSDIRAEAVQKVVDDTGARAIGPGGAHRAKVDIFAPCALGGGLNEKTIPEIRAEIICGAANNQLATPEDGARLAERGILYAPDYIVNAGGLISVARPTLHMNDVTATERLAEIPKTLVTILKLAEQAGMSPDKAADRIASDRIIEGQPAAPAKKLSA